MARFRKKAVIIEAEQFLESSSRLPTGVCLGEGCLPNGFLALEPHVHTMHNNQAVVIVNGDWIIPEPDGVHYYPCKPEIFAATYESAIFELIRSIPGKPMTEERLDQLDTYGSYSLSGVELRELIAAVRRLRT